MNTGEFNMTIGICDSEKANQIMLNSIVDYYFKLKHISINTLFYDSGKALLTDYEEELIYPDILMTDIKLKDSNGFEVCKELREHKYKGDIILESRTNDYAVDGYKINAKGYLIKPYEAQTVYESLDRITKERIKNVFIVKNYNLIIPIPLQDILYIESSNTKCTIHCQNNKNYNVYKKLSDIESEIHSNHFLRCHRSYLVNMEHILRANNSEFVLDAHESIPIKRTGRNKIKEMFNTYLMN